MNVTLACESNGLTIWFSEPDRGAIPRKIEDVPQCSLLCGADGAIKGFSFISELTDLCPYELAKQSKTHAGTTLPARLESTFDSECDMGYIYFDKRGPGSVKRSIDCGDVVLDIGEDGAIIGIEVFSPSTNMPALRAVTRGGWRRVPLAACQSVCGRPSLLLGFVIRYCPKTRQANRRQLDQRQRLA